MTTYATRLAEVHSKVSDALTKRRAVHGASMTADDDALSAIDNAIRDYQAVGREIIAERRTPSTPTGG